MGAGLFTLRDARLAYAEPYSELYDTYGSYEDRYRDLWREAFRALESVVIGAAGSSFRRVDEWHHPGLRTIARSSLHEVGLHEDDYGRIHIAILLARDAVGGPHETFARASLDRSADRIFDAIEVHYTLRVRTTSWTSAPRTPRAA